MRSFIKSVWAPLPRNSDIEKQMSTPERLPPKVEEQRLLEIATGLPGTRIGCVSTGRGQAAETLAATRTEATVTAWYLDSYLTSLAIAHAVPQPNLRIACEADWPCGSIDLAAIALSSHGEAELTRDVLQSAYHALDVGGLMVVGVDNSRDRWLHDLLKTYEKSVKVRPFDDAMVYIIEKSAPLKKVKDFSCQLSFIDCDAKIEFVTRPGVFSHRELDSGARQLLDAVDVFPESKVLDIGCGAGSVALGLAARDPSATVHAIDSNSRAVDCTRRGVKLNGFENLHVELNHSGDYGLENSFDMALANPPYFADFRIAQHFIDLAHRSLRPGGRLVLVTKQPKWYEENLPIKFNDVEVFESKRYFIASGVKG
jgi:16S rRNA G1207 methylase RsmC